MEPAHPEFCSFWNGNQSSPRPVCSCLEGGRLRGAERERECLISACLSLSPPSVLTNAVLSSPERAAGAILGGPGRLAHVPSRTGHQ